MLWSSASEWVCSDITCSTLYMAAVLLCHRKHGWLVHDAVPAGGAASHNCLFLFPSCSGDEKDIFHINILHRQPCKLLQLPPCCDVMMCLCPQCRLTHTLMLCCVGRQWLCADGGQRTQHPLCLWKYVWAARTSAGTLVRGTQLRTGGGGKEERRYWCVWQVCE